MPTKPLMVDERYPVTSEQHEAALRAIEQENLVGRAASSSPAITIVLGQPGAGKSVSAGQAVTDLSASGNPVHVDLDELRKYHPQFRRIQAEQGINASTFNHGEAASYADHLLTTAIAGKKNVVWETTGAGLDNIQKVINLAKQNQYGVNVRVVATQPEVSAAAVIGRYEQGLQGGLGRFVPLDFHDHVVRVLPDNLERIGQSAQVDSWGVYNRQGTRMFPESGAGTAPGAAQTVRQEFGRVLSMAERDEIGGFFRLMTHSFQHEYPNADVNRPPDYRMTVTLRGQPYTPVAGDPNVLNVLATTEAPPVPPSTLPTTPSPAPLNTTTSEAVAARAIAKVQTAPREGEPQLPRETGTPTEARAPVSSGGRFVTGSTAVAGAGLGILGVEQRLASGQLNRDVHGNKVQAAAGSAAFLADAANAVGGVATATVRLLPTASEALTGASRLAGRAALPLAIASTGFDMVAGVASHDTGRVVGAGGRLGGGILGGVVAGGVAGLVLGSETGPGAIITGLVGAVVGGYYGEKAARAATDRVQNWFSNHNPFHETNAAPPLSGVHHDIIVPPHTAPPAHEERQASLHPPAPGNRRVSAPMRGMVFAEHEPAAASSNSTTTHKAPAAPGSRATI